MMGFDPPRAKRIKEGSLGWEGWKERVGDLASVCHVVGERIDGESQKRHEISRCSFQYSAFITVILAGQVALCAVTAVYKSEVSCFPWEFGSLRSRVSTYALLLICLYVVLPFLRWMACSRDSRQTAGWAASGRFLPASHVGGNMTSRALLLYLSFSERTSQYSSPVTLVKS